MKLKRTTLMITGVLLLIAQMALAGNKLTPPTTFSKRLNTTPPTDSPIIPPEAREFSLLGCVNSRPTCRPNFVLRRTGCAAGTFDSDYECYTCGVDPVLANRATCPSGWSLTWTTSGYNCSSDCRGNCLNADNNDHDSAALERCILSCPTTPFPSNGSGCSEGFTQQNQVQGSYYSCFFDNAPTIAQDRVCATCGAEGYSLGSNAEFNCVRRVHTEAPSTSK